MVSILGANGAIGSELVKELTTRNESIRLVSRNPKLVPGAAEAVAADLSNLDDTLKAVSGSRVAFLVVGLKYDFKVWRQGWASLFQNANPTLTSSPYTIVLFYKFCIYVQWDSVTNAVD